MKFFIRPLLTLLVLVGLIAAGQIHGLISPALPGIGALLNPFSGIWQQADSPRNDGAENSIKLSGINGEVVFDEQGIPHVFANSVTDAAFIQGYLHAHDRLWQMDISTRASGGRLAELLGPGLLERDSIQCRKGMRHTAKKTAEIWMKDEVIGPILEAYCRGANAWIDGLKPKDYPVEYKILGHAPVRWTPELAALHALGMSESLCFRHDDIKASQTRQLLGDSLYWHLFPEHNPLQSPVIPEGTAWEYITGQTTPTPDAGLTSWQGALPALEQAPEGIGSNNWAVAGSKTASGVPMLANDPHLGLTLPSIWYQIQLHCPELNAYGVSLPGLPLILIGFNEHAAWGITNVGHDVLDWYNIQWEDATCHNYLLDGKMVAAEWVSDTIRVKGQEQSIVVKTPWTQFGPVVYQSPEHPYHNLAMRWLANDVTSFNKFKTFLGLAKSQTLADYQTALQQFDHPASNIVFANQQGDIALTVTGSFPHRTPGQGHFIADGKTASSTWSEYLPQRYNARSLNPERAFVASANQTSTAADYPYYYLGSFDDYRGRYINRRLENLQKATFDDMQALQNDSYSQEAEDVLPTLLKAVSGEDNATALSAIELLKQWDLRYTATAQAPVLFEAWLDTLHNLTFDEIPSDEERSYLQPETWRLIDLVVNHPKDPIFDLQSTPQQREDAKTIIIMALRRMAKATMPAITAGQTWNISRGSTIPHIGRIPGFGSDTLVMDGYGNAPNAMKGSHGPSWRMIVALSQPIQAWGVLPGGPTGNPGHPRYMQGLEEWQAGAYFNLILMENSTDSRVKPSAKWRFGE